MATALKNVGKGKNVGKLAAALEKKTPIIPAAPVKLEPAAPKQDTAPDYSNMEPAALLASYWGWIKHPLADAAALIVNTVGAAAPGNVGGELSALVSAALGMRKAYGRGIKLATIRADLPSLTLPDGFTPTFALYLSAARLRPDNKAERDIAANVGKAIRNKIREARKAK